MYVASNNGPYGLQPHGVKTLCVNRSGATLAIGDVVINSYTHTGFAYPGAATPTGMRLNVLNCVTRALDAVSTDAATTHAGYIGVVTGLGQNNGADGQDVEVQFGGVVTAKVNPTTNATVIGTRLYLSGTAGVLTNHTGSAAPRSTVGIALGATAAGATGLIPVLLFNGPIDGSNASTATVP